MLYTIYNSLKTAILGVSSIKDIQWFNMQYDSTIVAEPIVFIEFPNPLESTPTTKMLKQAPLRVRLHIATKNIARIDSAVADDSIIKHEAIATAVKEHLNGVKMDNCTPLQFASWQHWHRWQGWMVTFVDFEIKVTI